MARSPVLAPRPRCTVARTIARAVALACAGLAFGALQAQTPATPAAPAAASAAASASAPVVRVVVATASPIKTTLRLPARAMAAEEARIFARTSGTVAERRVDLGDRVKAGELLLRIAAPEVDQSLERARAAVGQTRAREHLAQLNVDRAKPLVEQQFLSPSGLDNLVANLAVAHADTAAAVAEVKRLEAVQQFQWVRAPFAGVITERLVERGDRVSGDSGDAYLLRLAKLDELRVVVDVPQSSAIDVPLGAVVPLSFREFPGETFKATLRRRSGAIDAATGTMRIELALPNPELRLPAGLRGEAVLEVNSLGGVRVPSGALLSRDGKPHAAIVDAQGRLRFVAVQVDRTSDREVVIRSGLDAGAKVVMPLSSLLREGAQVTIAP
jgi:RND family efflux transporter MFP subunit